MATEELNNQVEPEPGDTGDDNNETFELTDGKFEEYIEKILDKEQVNAESKKTVKQTNFTQKESVKDYKTCSLIQSENACSEYSKIDNVIATPLGQSIAELQTNIGTYIAYGGEMEGALTTALQALKEARTKLEGVNTAACKLENAMKDSCNSEQLKALVTGIQKLDEKYPPNKFRTDVQAIQEQVDNVNEAGFNVFETGIKVAGIARFANIVSLKAYGDNLKTAVDKLTTDVTGNIAFSSEEKAKIQKEMTAALKDLVKARYEYMFAELKLKALNNTEEYVGEPSYPVDEEGDQVTLQSICDKVEGSFGICNDEV